MPNYIEYIEYVDLALQTVTLTLVVVMLFKFKALRIFIGRLREDNARVLISPELIKVWKRQVRRFPKGSYQYDAYVASLKKADAWDGD